MWGLTCDESLFSHHGQTQGRVTEASVECEDVAAQVLVRSLLVREKFPQSLIIDLAYHD